MEFVKSAVIYSFVICLLEKDYKDMWILLDSTKRTLVQYLRLFDNLNTACFLLDNQGRILTGNKKANEILNAFSPDASTITSFKDLFSDCTDHIDSCINNLSIGQSSTFDTHLHIKDQHKLFKVILKRVSFSSDHIFSVVFIDISDNYTLQQSFFDYWLKNSEQSLDQLKEMDISSDYDCLKVEDFNNLEHSILDNFYIIIAFGDKLGKISCKKNLFCAQAELEEIINCVWKKAEKKELHVNLVLDEELPKGIEGDKLLIKLLYRSLLDYIIKYSASKSCIRIMLKVDRRMLASDGPLEKFLSLKFQFVGNELSMYDLEYYFKKRVNMALNYREMVEVTDKNGISVGVMHIIMRYLQVIVEDIKIQPAQDNKICISLLVPINSVPDSKNTRGRIGVIYGNRNLNDIRIRWVPQNIRDANNSRIRTYLSFSQVRKNRRMIKGREADRKSCRFGSRMTDTSLETMAKLTIQAKNPVIIPEELGMMDYKSDDEFQNIEEDVAVDARSKLYRKLVRNRLDMAIHRYRSREEPSTTDQTETIMPIDLAIERDINKVMLVMTSKIMAKSISKTLSKVIRNDPDTVSSTQDALNLYKTYAESGFRYLVMFIDSKVNSDSGLMLARAIRELEHEKHYVRTPIFMFYQESDESVVRELQSPEIDQILPRSANQETFVKLFSHLQEFIHL